MRVESTISFTDTQTRNGQWRATEQAHADMMEILTRAERLWLDSPQDMDARRFACTDVLIALTTFGRRIGLPDFASERLDELIHSLAEANWGHDAPLLARTPLHPSTLSPVDLMYQGAAQTCVDLYTAARVPVGQARIRTARQFHLKGIKGFSVPSLVKLGSRLSGHRAKTDRAFGYYQMSWEFARRELLRRGGGDRPTESMAENVAKAVIREAISADKRPK